MHLASVWVPFTSEAKEAVAHYPELLDEIKLGLREVGRRLGGHLRARQRERADAERRSLFERYIPEVSQAIARILDDDKAKIEKQFMKALENFARTAALQDAADAASDAAPEPTASTPSVMPPADDAPESRPKAQTKTKDKGKKPEPAAPGKGTKTRKQAELPRAGSKRKPEQLELIPKAPALPVIHPMKR